jgi:hypothetical protein
MAGSRHLLLNLLLNPHPPQLHLNPVVASLVRARGPPAAVAILVAILEVRSAVPVPNSAISKVLVGLVEARLWRVAVPKMEVLEAVEAVEVRAAVLAVRFHLVRLIVLLPLVVIPVHPHPAVRVVRAVKSALVVVVALRRRPRCRQIQPLLPVVGVRVKPCEILKILALVGTARKRQLRSIVLKRVVILL